MKNFKLWNNALAWLSFAIAAVTYLLTMEPTASFWDCGEFISAAYKLDVGHPPGAPFFMLTGRFFSLFASDPSDVAMMVNAMSALASAFTILFLFWTITQLGQKLFVDRREDLTLGKAMGILGAGLVGALVYTFSDTFWFSAVEGEVYAYSSLFTAVVFWLVLKWDAASDEAGSDRWLILIAYLMGLSIGVHLLNLLAIPAIVLVYYFRKYEPTTKGFCAAMAVAGAILLVVLYGLVPGFVAVACWAELLFVNTLGLPFNTGLFIYITLAVAALVWAIWETYTATHYVRMVVSFMVAISLIGVPFIRESVIVGILLIVAAGAFFYLKPDMVSARWLNLIVVSAAVMLIGYSSYTVIVIRSAAQPPMDQNSPDNVFSLKYFLNREQYGDRPLFFGSTYNAPVALKVEGNMCIPIEEQGAAQYAPKPKANEGEKDEYVVTGYKTSYEMNDKFDMLFPRMYSSQAHHVSAYKSWAQIKGEKVTYEHCGQTKTEIKPTFVENMRFFFRYQVNFMYLRYFMWNFSGRQNDVQGHGEIDNGNWITGIPFIDNALVGDQTNLPDQMKENRGRNTYYMLPLLLGLIGIFFQLNHGKRGQQNFAITFLLFFLTGLAIVVYLNQTPYQPRERDYAYAGSFYAFSIWVGLGVLGVMRAVDKLINSKPTAAVIATLACLGVPALMASENWDDHDRSGRYAARDFGYNYLMSTKPNAILFSNGDNDTFPLWYNQEVEGARTDVRVCNLSYLQTDWYISQMKRPYYESAKLPISWEPEHYLTGKNEVVWVEDRLGQPATVDAVYGFVLSDDKRTKLRGDAYIPTSEVFIPVDKQDVMRSAAFAPQPKLSDSVHQPMTLEANCEIHPEEIVDRIDIKLGKRMTKSEMMVVEMLNENKWERPMYYCVSVGNDYYQGMEKYFDLVGLAYQITPVASADGQPRVNTEQMYENLMHVFRYGNVGDPDVYLDETVLRTCRTHRMMFVQMVDALLQEGQREKAIKALDYCQEVLPSYNVPHDSYSINMAGAYYELGEMEKGNAIFDEMATYAAQYIIWAQDLSKEQRASIQRNVDNERAVLGHIVRTAKRYGQDELAEKFMK